jgi:D-glucuronyl C5-epimerase C-terminus
MTRGEPSLARKAVAGKAMIGKAMIGKAMIGKGLRDLRLRAYPVYAGAPLDASGRYPLDLRSVAARFQLDPDGVVVTPGAGGREYHNPVSASLHALARHTGAASGAADRESSLAIFLAQARHLRRSQDASGGWRYPVPATRYRVMPGWYSAMAQGLATSVLLRAHDLTGEGSYIDAADGAVMLLLKPVQDGGCAHYDQSGRPFLEECPSDPPCHILNGAVFALIGLHEREARSGGHAYLAAAERLAAELNRFDLGYWSRYDLRFAAPATMAYHSLHSSLLEVAARISADPVFGSTATRWRSYLRSPTCRLRAAAAKALFVLGGEGG